MSQLFTSGGQSVAQSISPTYVYIYLYGSLYFKMVSFSLQRHFKLQVFSMLQYQDVEAETPRCWSWNSSTLATWCEELTHWKRPWCWERLRAEGEGDDRGWDGWMESSTRWTWVWVDSGSWWWTGRPRMLWFMGSQRVGNDWATELNWIPRS